MALLQPPESITSSSLKIRRTNSLHLAFAYLKAALSAVPVPAFHASGSIRALAIVAGSFRLLADPLPEP